MKNMEMHQGISFVKYFTIGLAANFERFYLEVCSQSSWTSKINKLFLFDFVTFYIVEISQAYWTHM